MPSRSRGRGPEVLQEGRGRHEEEVPGDRTAEVEQPVIIARWIADEHVLEHFFDRAGRAAVTDEIGPELPPGCLAERHVVSEDLDLRAILRHLGECICAKVGLTESSSSMSLSFVRPTIRSCSSVGSAFQPVRSWRYFCTIT